MKIGTIVLSLAQSIILGFLLYREIGWMGPAIILGLYVASSIINALTHNKTYPA